MCALPLSVRPHPLYSRRRGRGGGVGGGGVPAGRWRRLTSCLSFEDVSRGMFSPVSDHLLMRDLEMRDRPDSRLFRGPDGPEWANPP